VHLVRLAFFLTCAAAWAQDTRVILLGTGTPNPEPDHMGPAVAVVSGDRAYIVDCGPGVVRRAAEAGIRMEQLTRAFFTHLHSDHTSGYPDLILTPPNAGRREPLEVFGPPGLHAMTAHLLKAYQQDFAIRLHGTQPGEPGGFAVTAHDVRPGEVYRDGQMRVVAFAVSHGAWKYAYGYRFEARDKVIVISGDTTYSDALIAAAKGCDILVHEVYSQKGWEARTPEWRKYHAA
jgi:ribonuclease Z